VHPMVKVDLPELRFPKYILLLDVVASYSHWLVSENEAIPNSQSQAVA